MFRNATAPGKIREGNGFKNVSHRVPRAAHPWVVGQFRCSGVYNGVGVVKRFSATPPPLRAGRGVKGERSEFIADP